VKRPSIGECVDVFDGAVSLRSCVATDAEAKERAQEALLRLSISELGTFANVQQAYVNQQCRLRWIDWLTPPPFIYTCYGGSLEMQPCKGADDTYTCTLGTCVRLADRPDWPVDWWQRVDPTQYGGTPPTLYDTRQWYCDDAPALPIGRGTGAGSQAISVLSSNQWVKHECDTYDELGNLLNALDADKQCANVTAEAPVEKASPRPCPSHLGEPPCTPPPPAHPPARARAPTHRVGPPCWRGS